jgi:hypothetical protein
MRLSQCAMTAVLLGAFMGAAAPVHADDTCAQFQWDVAVERTLFAGQALSLSAGRAEKGAPVLSLSRLYELRLLPQDQVSFSVAPAKRTPIAGAYAGLAVFNVPAAGSYRVAVEIPLWIDVIAHGAAVPAKDFVGQHGCNAPHKIVEFELSGGQPFVLQLSAATQSTLRLTITPSPARKL